MLAAFCLLSELTFPRQTPQLESNGLWGYINMSVTPPPEGYGYGVSLYSAAWPLLEHPIANFQIGLASTWILPDNRSVTTPLVPKGTLARDSMPERGPSYWTVFQTIEGGLGFWASNKFLAPTAKFRMNGTPDGYNHELSTPGWEFGGKPLPGDQMGIAQLSSHVLIPPDGVTLAKGTCGELFGYAWMALPLVPSQTKPVATGNQCWTSFFNLKNFRGPVAFYLPVAWSRMSRNFPPAVGRGLDARPGIADSGAIEINTVPQLTSPAVDGQSYARVPQLQFPADSSGKTVLMHNVTVYSKAALWDQVANWQAGGETPSSEFRSAGAYLPEIQANPLQVRQGTKRWVRGIEDWVATARLDPHTFGLQWKPAALTEWNGELWKGSFPAYFRHQGEAVEVVPRDRVPESTGLISADFPAPTRTDSYKVPDDLAPVWHKPGPKAGPFKAKLADGSTVTYYWYRFIDQPALQNAGLSVAEKTNLQALVETIHRSWTPDKTYMAPPSRGSLASIDPALLVKPPKGLEVGYVPISTRQDP